jgi:hypothetical protein
LTAQSTQCPLVDLERSEQILLADRRGGTSPVRRVPKSTFVERCTVTFDDGTPATDRGPRRVIDFMRVTGLLVGALDVVFVAVAFVEIGAHTMLQRVCSETMTSRAFGVLDSALLVATAIGAGVAGVIIADNDLTLVLATLGAVAAVVLVMLSIGLRRTERASPGPADVTMVGMLRTVAFLEPLPLPTLERLVRGLECRDVAARCCLIAEGDHGSEFFILLDGAADITLAGEPAGHIAAPASFGEVALLHDSRRTATVTTTEPSRLAVIQRTDFLEAIKRTETSHRTALAVSQSYRPRTDS